MKTSPLALLMLGVGAFCARAHAVPQYASSIRTTYLLTVDELTICQYCHNGATQRGTVTRAFGQRMTGLGLSGSSAAPGTEVTVIIDGLLATNDPVDSDGDGSADVLEVTENSNPSDPSVFLEDNGDGAFSVIGLITIPDQTFGCGAHISRSTHTSTRAMLGMLAVGVLGLLRRRRQH